MGREAQRPAVSTLIEKLPLSGQELTGWVTRLLAWNTGISDRTGGGIGVGVRGHSFHDDEAPPACLPASTAACHR